MLNVLGYVEKIKLYYTFSTVFDLRIGVRHSQMTAEPREESPTYNVAYLDSC